MVVKQPHHSRQKTIGEQDALPVESKNTGRRWYIKNQTVWEIMRLAEQSERPVVSLPTNSSEREVPESTGLGTRNSLLLFNQRLVALLDAGLHLGAALESLGAKEKSILARKFYLSLVDTLAEGKSFSDALARYPTQFPAIYIATIKAAEQTGGLVLALERYIEYQIRVEEVRKKIVSAATYPTMLLIVGAFVVLFLLGYVVPRFATVYETSGRELPLMSELLLSFGRLVYVQWPSLLIGFISIGIGFFLLLRKKKNQWIADLGKSLPWVSERYEQFRFSRALRAMSMLMAAGIALPKAMTMSADLLASSQSQRFSASKIAINQGESLSNALRKNNLSDPVTESFIRVGEESGKMAEMLERSARFMDDELARWIDQFSRLLEPILMLVIGLVIGMVVVLMYIPIFELAGSL